jgi:hypothetical protein
MIDKRAPANTGSAQGASHTQDDQLDPAGCCVRLQLLHPPPRRHLAPGGVCEYELVLRQFLDQLLTRAFSPPSAMPPRKRRQAGALAAGGGDGDGAGPGLSSERAAAAAAGLLDVLEVAVLVGLLDLEAMCALRMAGRAACAAVERMATRMVLTLDEHYDVVAIRRMELQAGAQHDTVALRRLAGRLPNVHSLMCNTNKEGTAGFMAAAGLLGEFAASRPNAAAGVRTMGLGLSSQTLGPELPLVLVAFCNLQARCLTLWARSRLCLVGLSLNPHMLPSNRPHSCCRSTPARCRLTCPTHLSPRPPPPAPSPPRRCVQELFIDCRPCLAFKLGSLELLGRGGLQVLTLGCDWLSADTLQHLGCLTGLTQLGVLSEGVHAPGDPGTAASPATALAHLTALSGLTRLAHLDLDLGGQEGEEAPAAELLAALPRAPLETVRRAGWRRAGLEGGT